MGQAPSASRFSDSQRNDILGAEGRRTKVPAIRDDRDLCSSGGCLPVCLLPFSRARGRHRTAFELAEQCTNEDSCGGGAITTVITVDSPPDDLVLTDVEDEDDDEEEDGADGERMIQPAREEEGGEIPKATADETAPLLIPEDLPQNEGGEIPKATIEETTPPVIPEDVISRIVAVDCGQVMLPGGRKMRSDTTNRRDVLRRVCIVDGNGSSLLIALVRVDDAYPCYYSAVARYLSSLLPRPRRINRSGDDLDLGVSAEQVKEDAAELLRGKIVVGHQVEGDLAILGLGRFTDTMNDKGGTRWRDFEVRDTARYEPFQCNRTAQKLRDLVRERLDREIQPDGKFHCCEEDAVAALDLYKSVYHEWEAHLKLSAKNAKEEGTGNTSHIRQQRAGSKKDKKQGAKRQPMISPTALPGGRRTKVDQNKKRKKKKKKKTKKQKNASNQTTVGGKSWLDTIYTTIPQCNNVVSSTGTLFFYPLNLLTRITHDLTRLTREMTLYVIRYTRQKNGENGVSIQKPFDQKRKKKNKKKSKHFLFMQHFKKYFDTFFLLCHCLLEAWTILSLMICCWCIAPDGDIQSSMLHRLNGALSVGLIGLNLFWRKKRNGNESRVLFGILAQYRFVCILAALARMTSGGTDSNLTVHTAQDREVSPMLLAIEQSTYSGLARLIRPKTGIAPSAKTTGGNVSLILKYTLPFLQTGSTKLQHMGGLIMSAAYHNESLPLIADLALLFWFALRAVKKL